MALVLHALFPAHIDASGLVGLVVHSQMAKTDWRTDVRLTADAQADDRLAAERVGDDRPFVIAVLGDFTGAGEDGSPAPATAPRRLIEVDRDNFDAVLARFNVRWRGELQAAAPVPAPLPVHITLREFDDFHPDRIVAQIEPLRVLLETRRALEDPARFEDAAAEVMRWAKVPSAAPAAPPPEPAAVVPIDVKPSELLERILSESAHEETPSSPQLGRGDLQRFLETVVGPHLVRVDQARQTALTRAVDQALSQQVRSVLHESSFQRIEAAWRSLRWLVHTAESGSTLKIRVVQLTKDELQSDADANTPPEDSRLGRLLLEPSLAPPALLVGNYEFAHRGEDVGVLQHVGRIARMLRAPFIAAASGALLGWDSLDEMPSATTVARRFEEPGYGEWQALRASPEARWLALALPRLLCRVPYGASRDPVESFDFEEPAAGAGHEQLLWGNPAFAVAAVIAGAFAAEGWSLDPSSEVQRLEGLPLYVYDDDGTAVTQPCAEALLNERLVEVLEQAGLIPVVAYRDADTIALPCLQSLAAPRAPLAWTESS